MRHACKRVVGRGGYTCRSSLVSAATGWALSTVEHAQVAMSFPLLITASGIIVSLFTTFIATDLRPARLVDEIEQTLKYQLIISTVIMTPVSPYRPAAAYNLYPFYVGCKGLAVGISCVLFGSASNAVPSEDKRAARPQTLHCLY